MKRRILLGVAIALLLILSLPWLTEQIRVKYLTLQQGTTLTDAAMRFEVVTNSLSGSRESYYNEERPKFNSVATGPALRGRLGYWDSVWEEVLANPPNLYLVTGQRLSNARVVEYDGDQAKMLAWIQWHFRLVNRDTMLTKHENDAAAECTYWFVFEDKVWKVAEVECAGPSE